MTTHHLGSLGVDVSAGNDTGEPLEYPRAYHGQKLAQARRAIANPRQWDALISLAEERDPIEDIGRRWLGCRQRGQAYIAGLALVSLGLHRLAILWGIAKDYHQTDPDGA